MPTRTEAKSALCHDLTAIVVARPHRSIEDLPPPRNFIGSPARNVGTMIARSRGMRMFVLCAVAVAGLLVGCAHQSAWKVKDGDNWPMQTWDTHRLAVAPSIAHRCERPSMQPSKLGRDACCDTPVSKNSWGEYAARCGGRDQTRAIERKTAHGKVIVETYQRVVTPAITPPPPTTAPPTVEPQNPILPPGDRALNSVVPRTTLITYPRP